MAGANRGSLDPKVLAAVKNMELKARVLVQGLYIGLHDSPYYGYSCEFADHRQYYPGDDVRSVDWKVYGRTDRYFLKRYRMEADMPVMVLLDTSASMGYKSHHVLSKLDYAVHLAAGLSHLVIQQNDRAGLVLFDGQVQTFMPPRGGKRHLWQILHHLDRVTAGEPTRIIDVCHEVAQRLRQRGLVVLVSDFLDADYERLHRCLGHFRFSGYDTIVLQVLDPTEIEFPFNRTRNFADVETGEEFVVEPLGFRSRYRDRLERFRRSVEQQCLDCHYDYELVNTAHPIERVLHQYLAKRARLRSK
ncbi:MAG: DUF58 domain-containing protein [Planctomycetota bacterium]